MFGIPAPGRPYNIHFSVFLPRIPNFVFSRWSAKTRGRAANNAEHTNAAEYGVMSTDCEYNSVARKRREYNVLEKKNFSNLDRY
jgi:hypothetical protein